MTGDRNITSLSTIEACNLIATRQLAAHRWEFRYNRREVPLTSGNLPEKAYAAA
jgi:hypothetical protein